jgi:hypothetical protein
MGDRPDITIPEEAPKQWTLDELTATDEESERFDQMVALATIVHSVTREVGVDLSNMTAERLINAIMREWLPGVEAAALERIADDLNTRAVARHQIGEDNGSECDEDCELSGCHASAAADTYTLTRDRLRVRAAELRGGAK